ncbi:MAG: potassium transporter [Epsilonproteobacteria bacterium]|nr:potassium transporter [Campylobacterota bacterium]
MEIIIAGAGKVGYNLAKTLSIYHNITIIDKNYEAISKIQDNLDVMALHGNIENPQVYFKCTKKIDYFIAVTNFDEVNIIASLIIDDIIKVDKKIIRLKNSFFLNSSIFQKLNIYKSIFSSYHIANTLNKLLEFPYANNIKEFNISNKIMLSVRVHNPDYIGYNIREISKEFEDRVSIVGLERDKRFFIPNYSEVIKSGDLIYIFGSKDIIKNRYQNLETRTIKEKKSKNCIVFGADRLGVEISKVLLNKNFEVKLIETDLKLCETASEALQGKAIILNSKYGWGHLLKEEGLDSADMLIAATNNDEYNIIKCIEGKKAGIDKVIAINNDREYYSLMHSLELIVIRGEKIDTYYSILENINTDSFIAQKRYCGGRGITLSKNISEKSKCIGKIINIPQKIKDIAQVYLIKGDEILRELDNLKCQDGDTLMLFSQSKYSDLLEKWLYKEI